VIIRFRSIQNPASISTSPLWIESWWVHISVACNAVTSTSVVNQVVWLDGCWSAELHPVLSSADSRLMLIVTSRQAAMQGPAAAWQLLLSML